MTRQLSWQAPAKVNLVLEVHGRRSDGFHELRTVFQAIELADLLHVSEAPRGTFSLACSDPMLATGDENLVTRAFRRIARERSLDRGVRVFLEKNIPDRAGLGGGSSNAAAMLVAVDHLFSLGFSIAELESLASDLGSDVAFFLRGGTQLGEGRGERLTPLAPLSVGTFAVCVPAVRLATAEVYRRHAARPPGPRPLAGVAAMESALAAGDPARVGATLTNMLEPAAFELAPELAHAKTILASRSLGTALSGSGSAFFAYFETRAAADAFLAEEIVRHEFPLRLVADPRPCGVRRMSP